MAPRGLSPIPSTHIVEENRQQQVVFLEKRKEKIISIIEVLPMFAEKILSYTEVEFT